jgi:hypothetical protein
VYNAISVGEMVANINRMIATWAVGIQAFNLFYREIVSWRRQTMLLSFGCSVDLCVNESSSDVARMKERENIAFSNSKRTCRA